MANAIYDLARQSFATQNPSIDWDTDTIKAVLVQTGAGHYVVNTASDQFLTAIASGDRIATSSALTSVTGTAGVLDAADVTFSAVTGNTIGAIVLYKDTGSAATSPLIAYIDTATGLPVTPNGGSITITWDNGANRIAKI